MKENKIRYVIVAVAVCLMACGSMGLANAYGVFYRPMAEDLGVGQGAVTLHMSISRLVTGFASPVVASLLRRRMPFRVILGAGLAMMSGAGLMIWLSHNVYLIDAFALIHGIGVAACSMMIVTMLIGNWFVKSRGTLSGLALSFSGIGSAVSSPILTRCIASFGFRNTYLGFVIAIFLMVLPAVFLCPLKPEQVGMKPYGAEEVTHDVRKAYGRPDPELQKGSWMFILLSLLVVLTVALTSINSHLPSYAQSVGFTASAGALLLSASMMGNMSSKFLLGVIIDKVGVFKGYALMLASCLAGLVVMLTVHGSAAVLLAAGFLYGFSYSLGSLGLSSLTRQLYGDSNYSDAYSVISMLTYLSSGATVPLIGMIYDVTGSYTVSLLGGVTCAALSLLALAGIHRAMIRRDAAAEKKAAA